MIPIHCPHPFFPEDQTTPIPGYPLSKLAHEVGSTPFYLYSRAQLSDRVRRLRQFLPKAVALHFAVKANPMPALVQHLAAEVDGFDVASGGELRVALDTPMTREHISFAGPGKTRDELLMALAAGIILNVESEWELQQIHQLGQQYGYRPRVSLRVNPDFEIRGSGMRMGGGAKPFGIDSEKIPTIVRALDASTLTFCGFHIFSGSQSLNAEALIEAQKKSLELALWLAHQCQCTIPFLNLGGGFGIPYFPGEQPLDSQRVCEALAHALPAFQAAQPQTRLNIELGRHLVGEAGYYVCRVLDRKISRGQTFLITDGGLHHHLSASGNFGQVIRKNYPVRLISQITTKETETVTIVGPLCTPLDILADKMTLPRAQVGDLVVVLQSGAYGKTASPSAFLGHPPAQELLI